MATADSAHTPDRSVSAAIRGELALLGREVRSAPDRAARLLDPEFSEIGASGSRWTREAVLAALPTFEADDEPAAEVREMSGRLLAPGWVQLRFTTVRGERRVHRTSLWRLGEDAEGGERWRLYHHQGTPAASG
ncbi:nuclear transport factor 2 family protein [Streptomyces sp. SID8014]|uniref:DUF4440 domain-containing protein n=1 Tax=Streptomyces sp. SID8014 TaxID=2706097 RepID=UPI0013B9E6C1|nr:nuclear transport factor 2 family protein [Streptomyces sp. SID8014]